MRRGVRRMRENLVRAAVRLVVHPLPALVLDDVALRVELREIERVEQKTHAIGFEPERRLEIVGRHRLVVHRSIVVRRAVVGAAHALGELVVQPVRHVARSGEHDVLEEMGEAGTPRQLVLGADVKPGFDSDGRRRAIGRQNHCHAVRQRVGVERDPDRVGPGARRTLRSGTARCHEKRERCDAPADGQHDGIIEGRAARRSNLDIALTRWETAPTLFLPGARTLLSKRMIVMQTGLRGIARVALPLIAIPLLVALVTTQGQGGGAGQREPMINASTNPLLSSFRFRSIGPASMGGRIDDIAVSESDPNIIYIGYAVGGVFKSENNGTTFAPVFEAYDSASIGDIAIHPTNPSIVYVGTGEANNRQTSSFGDGIYNTTDGGKTFTHIGLRDTQTIARIVIDPKNPDTVYVASPRHLFGTHTER